MESENKQLELEGDTCHLFLCLRPSWARVLATKKVFALCYGFANIVQGMFFFYLIGTLTSIESHFQLPSEVLGTILSVGEVTCLITGFITGLIVTAKTHRPYGLAICLLLMGIGNNLFALPYYIWGSPIPLENVVNGTSAHSLCVQNSTVNTDDCTTSLLAPPGSSIWAVGIIFLIGQSMCNVGSVSMYIIGTPFIDDNVQNKNSPMYLALTASIRTIGPIFGSLLSSYCLTVYVMPNTPPPFDNHDSRWVGAWWIGYVVIGWLTILSAFTIAQFPQRLPSIEITPAMKMDLEEKKTIQSTEKKIEKDKVSKNFPSFQEIISSIRRIGCNWLLWLRTLSATFLWFALDGFTIYTPKYLEHEFHVTSSQASFMTGAAFLVPSVIGMVIMGFLIQRFQPSAKTLGGIIAICKILESIITASLAALQCDKTSMLGSGSSVPECADAICDCSEAVFSPICGSDGFSYYSACHAGCLNTIGNSEQDTILTNCSCIVNGGFATASICQIECPEKIIYLLLVALSKLCLSVDVIGSTVFVLRCVDPRDKTIATGLVASFLGLFAFIPCPIVFSALVDGSCIVWSEQCGRTGACNAYDMDTLRIGVIIVPAICIGISAIWDGLFWWFAKDKVQLYCDVDNINVNNEIVEEENKQKLNN